MFCTLTCHRSYRRLYCCVGHTIGRTLRLTIGLATGHAVGLTISLAINLTIFMRTCGLTDQQDGGWKVETIAHFPFFFMEKCAKKRKSRSWPGDEKEVIFIGVSCRLQWRICEIFYSLSWLKVLLCAAILISISRIECYLSLWLFHMHCTSTYHADFCVAQPLIRFLYTNFVLCHTVHFWGFHF